MCSRFGESSCLTDQPFPGEDACRLIRTLCRFLQSVRSTHELLVATRLLLLQIQLVVELRLQWLRYRRLPDQ